MPIPGSQLGKPLFAGPKKVDLSTAIYESTKKKKSPSQNSVVSVPKPLASSQKPHHPVKYAKNGLPKPTTTRKSLTPRPISRQASSEPREMVRNGKASLSRPGRLSPMANSPRFDSDDDEEEEDESEARRKRIKLNGGMKWMDKKRKIRDPAAFSTDPVVYDMVHAADIANTEIQKHGAYQFGEYFSTLGEGEEEHPTVELQYPCGNQTELYQLVRPTDRSDFKPLDEIAENMKIVSEFYLDADSAEKVNPNEFDGADGFVGKLARHARDSRPGAQQHFIDVIDQYNNLLTLKRQDGTIINKLDVMVSPLPFKLVNHIIKEQIYARTVSPHVDSVREYEGFSDNVYGELLPKFLSKIFQETRLRSDQVFVDLGSGVGNCVIQAALEIGCESWGCEVMANPAKLAQQQALEFPSRCRLWGIKPGKVRIIQDDFTANEEIRQALTRADVVLVNNQAFTPTLNDRLKSIFLDLKEGCQIVSLKYFRDPVHRVKESNINDLVNCLSVVEKERFSGMVSWSDDPGKWYLHTKDSTELKTVRARLETS